MKITIKGSPKEVAELLATLRDGVREAAKKADLPPLITELAKNENIHLFFGDGHIQRGGRNSRNNQA